MVKILRAALFIAVISVLGGSASGQQLLVSPAKNVELQDLSQELSRTFTTQQQAAIQLAPSRGWPISVKQADGSVMVLQGTNSLGKPIFYKTYTNVAAAATTQTNALQPGGVLGLNLSGASANMVDKLGIWDGGRVLSTHQEFQGKTISFKDGATGSDTHATHVGGTMVARGTYAPAKGMSFGATSLWSYDFNNDVSEMTAAAGTLLLSNHSYGAVVGWSYNSSQSRWEWYGLPGDAEDYEFGFYDTRTQSWDRIAYNAPYYLIVKSAGNSRGETGPAVGETYWGYTSRTNFTLINKGPRPAGISSNDGYDILPTYSTAKNILSVAAVNPLPFGPANKSDISISSFSSWGPTDDGRIKPDISGMGVNVLSTSNSSNTGYTTLSGTSMSSPNVTGSLNLLQEYYAQKNSGAFMRSSTLKGLVCHTAVDAGNTGPDYIYGWGLLNTRAAAQAITDRNGKSLITEATLTQGQTQTYNVVASGNGVLMATICWTDPEGTVTTDGVINSRTPKLVNDLDIRISDAGSNTFLPWILNPNTPSAAATTGDNILDNVEQVQITGATPGKAYTITVSHKGTLRSGSQAYALIATGVGGSAYCASAPASNADSRINNVTLSNINNTPAAGCTSYSDYTAQTIQLEQGKSYPLSITLGTCGNNFNKIAKVYIDYDGDGTFNPATELVAITSVISATGTYTGTINIPGNVVADNFSLMRIVMVETDNAASISPCGTYAKGETQDYRVQFVQTATDAGVVSVTTSTPGGACAGKTNISVRLKNYGKASISNIPVNVTITNPDNSVITINEIYTGNIAASAETSFILQGTFNTVASATYKLAATATLVNDPVSANNSATANVVTGSPATVTNLSAYYCVDAKSYILSGTSDGSIFWYRNANDAVPFSGGLLVGTTQAPVNNTFYAGVNDFSANVGPATKNVFTAGGYNQFSPSVRVSTTLPLVIESARLYIGNSGQITFTVSNSNGQVVSQSTINAVATRTTPAPGAQVNDPNDQGQVYTLNLLLPAAGIYTITANYDANATLYRNNGGVTGYPFTAGGVFSIIGNDATGTNPNDTEYYKNFYYYFYDMKIKSAGCASVARVAVPLTKPQITRRDTLLSSNFATGNQWYEDGVAIAGATSQTFAPQHSGNYTVGIQLSAGCMLMSDPFAYAVISLRPDNTEIGLSVFPVPAVTKLNVVFKALAADKLTISIVNNAGQVVYNKQQDIQAGNFSTVIDVSNQITGTYIVKVMLGTKTYASKILMVR